MRIHRAKRAELRVCTTRRGLHLYLKLDRKIPELEIVLIQALLGSDLNREMFNYRRIKEGFVPFWNVLFKVKIIVGKVVSRETFHKKTFFEIKEQKDIYIRETKKEK